MLVEQEVKLACLRLALDAKPENLSSLYVIARQIEHFVYGVLDADCDAAIKGRVNNQGVK